MRVKLGLYIREKFINIRTLSQGKQLPTEVMESVPLKTFRDRLDVYLSKKDKEISPNTMQG